MLLWRLKMLKNSKCLESAWWVKKHSVNVNFHCVFAVMVIIIIIPFVTVRDHSSAIKRLHADQTDAKYLDSHFCFSLLCCISWCWVWSNIARADSKLRDDNSSLSFLLGYMGHDEQCIFKGKLYSGFIDALVLESEIKENSSKFSNEAFYII